MTIPFRFAPGCCDPCGPVCGKTYSPEQFTVVSGTYDPTTKMLSPGGVLAVPYTGTNVYSIVALKIENQVPALANITYLYGSNPIEISIPAYSITATITHGTNVCTATVSASSTSARSFKAGPPNAIQIFDYTVFVTPEGKLLLYDWKGFLDQTRNTITLESLFVDSFPYIRNDSESSVQVDKIILYENQSGSEDAACNLTRRCSGYYDAGLGNILPFSGSPQLDDVDEIGLALSGSGCILNELSGTYALSRGDCLSDCYYKGSISCDLTLQVPMFGNRYVANVEKFSYPSEIVLVPFTLTLQGLIRLLPLDENECSLSLVFDSGVYTSPAIGVSGWRYICCPAAMGVWKNTPDGGTPSLYCWPSWSAPNAGFPDLSTDPLKVRINAYGDAKLPYSSVDFELGTSTPVSIPLALQSPTYDGGFPLAYQGGYLPNSEGVFFEGEHLVEWPGLEPCTEGYKTCPYGESFFSRGDSIPAYFENLTISASITGITHVL